MRRHFWRRRKTMILSYGVVAVATSSLALIATYVLLLSLAHMAHRGW